MKKNYLLSSILGAMLLAMPASADVIGMRTAVAVGENLSFALNAGVKATVAWGDGSSEDVKFDGNEISLTVRHADITIKTDKPVTNLFCPDCSLTELNVEGAPHLITLTCSANKLEKLDLTKVNGLVELNCDGNLLTSLNLSKCLNLQTVNVSDNKLSSFSVSSLTHLKTLLCANNGMKYLTLYNQHQLETLWCQNNSLKNLSFSSSASPVQICAFNNELETINAAALNSVKELWVDQNKLKSLDLSQAETEVLSASDNLLTLISLNPDNEKYLKAFYVDGNQLLYNSFPNVYKSTTQDSLIAYNIENQRPYYLTDVVNVNERLDVRPLVQKNASNDFTRVKFHWTDETGRELENRKDYKTTSMAFTFLKPFASVSCTMTSTSYPGVELHFVDFKVIDPTGVHEVGSDENTRISVINGGVQLVCSQETKVRIYSVSGSLIVDETVLAGNHRWMLNSGVYVVNGKKVVVGR